MNNRQETMPVYLGAAIASLLLSLWQILGIAQINHDAVYYLLAIQGDSASIQQIGNWLFYPRLIGIISSLSGLNTEISAHILNSLLDLLLVLAFIRLVEELGGNKRSLIWAAVVVLSLPYLNENRADIIRDHGYWAFTLAAMIFYLRLYRSFSWKSLLLWNGMMLVATLFRVEGVVFLALMPLTLMLNRAYSWHSRIRSTLLSFLPTMIIALLFVGATIHFGNTENRLIDSITRAGTVLDVFTQQIPDKARQLKAVVLPEFSRSSAEITIYLGIIYSIVKDLFSSLSWLYFGIFLARKPFPAPRLPAEAKTVITVYALISLAVLFVHGAQHFVMVSRYTMALALMLAVVAVFSLDELQRRIKDVPQRKPWLVIICMCIAILFIDSIFNTSRPKVYIIDAANWAQQNLPDGSKVLTDYHPERVGYYSNKNNNRHYEFLRYRTANTPLNNYDYAFVRTRNGKANSELQQKLYGQGLKPVKKIIRDKQGVIVYQLPGNH
jgi:hypothetical protein